MGLRGRQDRTEREAGWNCEGGRTGPRGGNTTPLPALANWAR